MVKFSIYLNRRVFVMFNHFTWPSRNIVDVLIHFLSLVIIFKNIIAFKVNRLVSMTSYHVTNYGTVNKIVSFSETNNQIYQGA